MQFSLLSTLSGVFESSGIFYYVWKSTLVIMWAGSPRCALAFSLLSDGKCCCDIPPAAHKCEIASEGLQGWRSPPQLGSLSRQYLFCHNEDKHVTLLDDPLLLGQAGIGEQWSNQTPSSNLLFRWRLNCGTCFGPARWRQQPRAFVAPTSTDRHREKKAFKCYPPLVTWLR